jgi:DNA-binding response OmpR family regulator
MAHVLLLDDETDICDEISYFLTQEGHQVRVSSTLADFRLAYRQQPADIVVLDRMLPDGDGLALVAQLREQGERCGVVLFTAKDASQDRIEGYQQGADHYLTKPVRLEELRAVVQSLVWRLQVHAAWLYNPSTQVLKTPNKDRIELTTSEGLFVQCLAQRVGHTVARQELIKAIGKNEAAYDSRNLDVLVMRLKKKIAAVSPNPLMLKTVHGVGYCIPCNVALSDV